MVTKSTRAWTSTYRFGQPKILTADGKDYNYKYPETVLHEIQDRPNLPPPPYEEPEEGTAAQFWTYLYTTEETLAREEEEFEQALTKDNLWSDNYSENRKLDFKAVLLIYHLPYVLVWYFKYSDKVYHIFASSDSFISEVKYQGLRYYQSFTLNDLLDRAKALYANRWLTTNE